ncbi:hypothetical protein FRC01_004706 [Tulasnella sp. 417]|nr:hypothetical protein FRC01_004706 [Tulasnella sp. 417]
MASRGYLCLSSRHAGDPEPLISPFLTYHRSSAEDYTNGAQTLQDPGATYSPDQAQQSDRAQCSPDSSLEDDDEENPDQRSPSAQLDDVKSCAYGYSKSGGQFMGKLKEMIQKETKHIKWGTDGSDVISIPNVGEFAAKALPIHFPGIKGTEGSLWLRKAALLPEDLSQRSTLLEQPPIASAPVAASVVPQPPDQRALEARMNELENKLAIVQAFLSEVGRELTTTNHFSQLDGANVYHAIHNGFASHAQAYPYGPGVPQGMSLGLEIEPSDDLVGPGFPTGHPTYPQSSGYDSWAGPEVFQTHPGGHRAPGGSFSQACWVPQSGFVTVPQAAGTRSRHHLQTSIPMTAAPFGSHYGPPGSIPEITYAHQAPTRPQLLSSYGASAESFGVPSPVNPNISEHLQQIQFPR